MKVLLLSTALAAGFALPGLVQDAPASPFQAEAAGPSAYASDIIGARVYVSEAALDADGYAGVQDGWDDIGEVNDVLLGNVSNAHKTRPLIIHSPSGENGGDETIPVVPLQSGA